MQAGKDVVGKVGARACNALAEYPLLAASPLVLAGCSEKEKTAAWGVFAVASLAAAGALHIHKRKAGEKLAEKYLPEQWKEAVDEYRKSKKPWSRDDIKHLYTGAKLVQKTLDKPVSERAELIDGYLSRWWRYSDGTYLSRPYIAPPAYAILALAQIAPESFTRELYLKMYNLTHGAFLPGYGAYIQDAVKALESTFGPIQTAEQDPDLVSRTVMVETFQVLRATGGVPRELVDQMSTQGGLLGALLGAVARQDLIKGGLDRQLTGLIRTGNDRVKEFTDTKDSTGLGDGGEERIIAKQADEMVSAVEARAQSEATGSAQQAVNELYRELADIYPGASNMMSYWLIMPMLEALKQLSANHSNWFDMTALEHNAHLRVIPGTPQAFTEAFLAITQNLGGTLVLPKADDGGTEAADAGEQA